MAYTINTYNTFWWNYTIDGYVSLNDTSLHWIHIGDIVETPKGRGKVYIIDDKIYCIELDNEHRNILHEFYHSELKKVNNKSTTRDLYNFNGNCEDWENWKRKRQI